MEEKVQEVKLSSMKCYTDKEMADYYFQENLKLKNDNDNKDSLIASKDIIICELEEKIRSLKIERLYKENELLTKVVGLQEAVDALSRY